MKKLTIILLLFLINNLLFSQIKVDNKSFKKVPSFVNINTDKMYDDNDQPYSVIKVRTENINDKQRHELLFQGDAQTFIEYEYKVGEVWLYISYYATYIKISHPDFSSTEFILPFDMEPKRGYELTLTKTIDEERIDSLKQKNEDLKQEIDSLKQENEDLKKKQGNGEIYINSLPNYANLTIIDKNKRIDSKTPYHNLLSAGEYSIEVSKDGFEKVVKDFYINKDTLIDLNISLPQLFSTVNFNIDPEPKKVFIDGKRVKYYNSYRLSFGIHNIKVKKPGYKKYKTLLMVNEAVDKNIFINLDKKPKKYIFGLDIGSFVVTIVIPSAIALCVFIYPIVNYGFNEH